MLSDLWGRVTGKDKGKQFPEQQGVVLGRIGDFTIIYPYGFYCDLPSDVLFRALGPGVAIPVTVDRPKDGEQGEPVFFHPETNTRIILRNNGDLDIETGEGGTAKVNIQCTQANVTASESVTLDTPLATCTENAQIDANLLVAILATVGGLQVNGVANGTGLATFGGVQANGTLSSTGVATLGGAGGAAIARVGDLVVGGVITTGSATHTAT